MYRKLIYLISFSEVNFRPQAIYYGYRRANVVLRLKTQIVFA